MQPLGMMRSLSVLALLPGVSGFTLHPTARRATAGENDVRQAKSSAPPSRYPGGRLFADSSSGGSGGAVAEEPRRKTWFATKAQETVDYSNVEAM